MFLPYLLPLCLCLYSSGFATAACISLPDVAVFLSTGGPGRRDTARVLNTYCVHYLRCHQQKDDEERRGGRCGFLLCPSLRVL